jgi:hypothetical protein
VTQDPHWAHWDQNCERTLWVHFKKYPVGTLVGTFQKNPPHTCWVTTRQIVSGLTKNSQWTYWVNSPLPPVQEGVPEGLERRGEGEDDEGGELPVLVGEPVEGDARAVGGESGELGLHGDGAVVGESEAVEVAPINDGGDAILLLVPRSEEFPEFMRSALSLSDGGGLDVRSLVGEEDLDVLRTCPGDEASGLLVGDLPFFDGGELLSTGRSGGGLG